MQVITPIMKLQGFEDNVCFIKRDDLLPFSFGGNKVRIAQEYFKDMYVKRKNCMIGYGNARSNLCRVIANISCAENVECHIISPADDDGSHVETNNSRIVRACGVQMHYCRKDLVSETVQSVLDACSSGGGYYIYGDRYGHGNEEVPMRAYVKVYKEIQKQMQSMNQKADYIFLAVGTGMTQAGLIAGQMIFGGDEKIVGISIARKKEHQEKVLRNMLAVYKEKNPSAFTCKEVAAVVEDAYICNGYGTCQEEIMETIRKMMCLNGIALDPVYTGKAFWGMLQYLRKNNIKNKKILFIHTGGAPLFFDHIALLT